MMSPPPRGTAAGRLAIFCIAALASVIGGIFVASAVVGMLGLSSPRADLIATSTVLCFALLALSTAVMRARGEPFTALGLTPLRTRWREYTLGFVIGLALFLGVAAAQSVMVGARWEFAGAAGVNAAASALGVTLLLVLIEELLFRGVLLQELRAMFGDRAAILLSAALFGAYHLVQAEAWGMGAVFTFLMPSLGGVLFAYAALRSNGLALPLGLHLGGNWVQAAVTGFSTIEADATHALWRISVSAADVRTLMAPDLWPRLPYITAVAVAMLAVYALSRSPRFSARN